MKGERVGTGTPSMSTCKRPNREARSLFREWVNWSGERSKTYGSERQRPGCRRPQTTLRKSGLWGRGR